MGSSHPKNARRFYNCYYDDPDLWPGDVYVFMTGYKATYTSLEKFKPLKESNAPQSS